MSEPSVPDLLTVDGTNWAQVHKDGPYHAVVQHWADPELWVLKCHRRSRYTDLQLFSLDSEPHGPVCRTFWCQWNAKAYARVFHSDAF